MRLIEIMNWIKFQHYSNRRPPWIKLYNDLLENYNFRCLQDDSKLLLILLWMVKSRLEGDIPDNEKYIRDITSFTGEYDLQPLIEYGFIKCYQDDSKMIASSNQNAIPETERETEIEREKETEKIAHSNNKKRFTKPTIQELEEYSKSISFNLDCQSFIDFYESKGWMVGKSPMKDWRAAIRTWKSRYPELHIKTEAEREEEKRLELERFGG